MSKLWDPFEGWTEDQLRSIELFERLLGEANRVVNLVSRATADEIRERHIVHSLTLSAHDFPDGTVVVDWGTGGGLPGIPLAIRYPKVTFHLVDSILKKTRALESICRDLGLPNVFVHRMRAEEWSMPIDYAVTRATASLETLWRWTEPFLGSPRSAAGTWPSGLLALKGGDLTDEISALKRFRRKAIVDQISLQDLTERPEFVDKYVVSVRRPS